MKDDSPAALLDFTRSLARLAIPMAQRPVDRASLARKADSSTVTSTDRGIQRLLVERIRESYPDHAIIAEEEQEESSDNLAAPARTEARFCWVLDPLDGTRNYAAGIPCYSISLAVLDRGHPVAAVIAEPNVHHLYAVADSSEGTVNAAPLRARDPDSKYAALVGFTSNRDSKSVAVFTHWIRARGIVLRNFGSTALQLALVASGALNATFSRKCKIWDIAAGALLVRQAGGVVTTAEGQPLLPFDLSLDPEANLPILAAAPQTHQRLLAMILA
ncbi:MAG: inositol monophosphatase family protein [Phycisphaerae bacterium]